MFSITLATRWFLEWWLTFYWCTYLWKWFSWCLLIALYVLVATVCVVVYIYIFSSNVFVNSYRYIYSIHILCMCSSLYYCYSFLRHSPNKRRIFFEHMKIARMTHCCVRNKPKISVTRISGSILNMASTMCIK